MSLWKRILLFLAVFLLVLFFVCIPFLRVIPSWIAALNHSWDDLPYQQASCGADNTVCAAHMERDGDLTLRFFDPSKSKSIVKWETTLPEDAVEGELCKLYPVGNQCAYVGFYEDDARYLSLYRASRGEAAERLMREECVGDTVVERKNSLAFSTMTQEQDAVSFVLLTKDTVRALVWEPGSGLSIRSETERNGALSAASLPDTLYVGKGAQMNLTFAGSGFFYLDGTDLSVRYGDLQEEKPSVEILNLDKLIGEHQLTSVSLMRDGSALLLLDGHILHLVREDGVLDLSDQLFPVWSDYIIRSFALLAAALILSLLLWWQMVVTFRRRLPITLYWGVVSFALFALAGVLFSYGLLGPMEKEEWLERRTDFTGDLVNLSLEQFGIQDEILPTVVSHMAESAGDEQIYGLRVAQVRRDGGNWTLPNGLRAETDPCVNIAFLNEAEEQGSASGKVGDRFWYSLTKGDCGLSVSFYWNENPAIRQVQKTLVAALAALAGAVFIILILIGHDVREMSKGLDRYAREREWKQIRVTGGDELEGMASTLNSLASERREKESMRERMVTSYRRFVPEQILALLGKQSVLEVDKNTLVSQRMAVMRVWFSFPDPVYTNEGNTQLLFDSVNQVIEHTASIFRKKGGAVFNYAFDGYEVVMEQDPGLVVSAAVSVQQEVLSFNEQRAQNALPTVTLRIAADIGKVIMGIVGDETQIEPATISDSLASLNELIRICGRVGAGILCTEALASGMKGYGSRYMGKCVVGQKEVRVYEVFDGDPYDVRRGKENGVRRFTEGVLSLYSGEIAQAKHLFLELVREAPRDVGARYYLFLADSWTKEDDLNGLFLNGRKGIEDEKT